MALSFQQEMLEQLEATELVLVGVGVVQVRMVLTEL